MNLNPTSHCLYLVTQDSGHLIDPELYFYQIEFWEFG